MDATLAKIVDFVESVDAGALPDATVREVVRHVVDTVGCGAGGYRSGPAEATRRVARGAGGALTASVYGEQDRVLVDFAALANGTANRYLDFNDFGSSGHPSDMIPAVLALAEATGASGRDVVASVYIAYEIATVLAESVPPTLGWDQGIYSSLGVAGALSKLLGFDRERTANALSLAIVPSVPLRVTRFGELSEWKAASVPHATMTASFATRLAGEGMSGPPEPFEGRYGLFEQVWDAFDLRLGGVFPSAVERSSLKRFGACYWGQVAIDIAVGLWEGADLARVASVDIATSGAAYRAIGGGVGDREQKWRPPTRETADHSMPFLVATALIDGAIRESSFDDLAEPARLGLMDRIDVREDEALSARSTRDRCPTRLVIEFDDGSAVEREQDFPMGHPENPMSDRVVAEKFLGFVELVLTAADATRLSELLWGLAELPNLNEVGAIFRRFGTGSPAET